MCLPAYQADLEEDSAESEPDACSAAAGISHAAGKPLDIRGHAWAGDRSVADVSYACSMLFIVSTSLTARPAS